MKDVISLKRLNSGDSRMTEDKGESAYFSTIVSAEKKIYHKNNTFPRGDESPR